MKIPFIDKFIKDNETKNKLSMFAEDVQKQTNTPDMDIHTKHGNGIYAAITNSFIGEYNPDNISINTYKKMRLDGQIKLGLKVIKLPIMALPYSVECKDEKIKCAVQQALDKIWHSLIRSMLNALDFGFAPMEKCWKYSDETITDNKGNDVLKKGLYVWDKFKDLDPATIQLKRNPLTDEFDGFTQYGINGISIPAEKAFVFSNEKEFGNNYGHSILKPDYEYWYWCNLIYQFYNRYLERRGTPATKGKAPNKMFKNLTTGETKNGLAYMQELGESLVSDSVITLPSEQDIKGNPLWDIDFMKTDDKGTMFLNYIEHLNTMKLRGIIVPERVATQDSATGSYSMAESHSNIFFASLDGISGDIEDCIDKYAIRQFIDYNFGTSAPSAYLKLAKLSKQNTEILKKIIESVVSSGQIPVDYVQVLEKLNIPIKQQEKKDKNDDEIIKEILKPEETERNKKTFYCQKGKYWRALTDREKAIDLEGIDDYLNKQEASFIKSANDILQQQKDLYMIQLSKILNNNITIAQKMREIDLLQVKYQGKYEDMVFSNITKTIEFNMKLAGKELGLRGLEMTPEAKAWAKSLSHTTVAKHLSELNAKITYPVLNGLNQKLSNQEIIFNTQSAFDNFIKARTVSLASGLSGKALARGRDIARASDPDIVSAQYTAILDSSTCGLCLELDGKIIDINDPDFYRFSAGDIHNDCRCIWIYIKKQEKPEHRIVDWVEPSSELVDRFGSNL